MASRIGRSVIDLLSLNLAMLTMVKSNASGVDIQGAYEPPIMKICNILIRKWKHRVQKSAHCLRTPLENFTLRHCGLPIDIKLLFVI